MDENQPIWLSWSRALHRWGISEAAASILEGAGSIGMLVAQVLYLSQPVLSGVVSERSLHALAVVLEDPAEKLAFVACLKEASSRGTSA